MPHELFLIHMKHEIDIYNADDKKNTSQEMDGREDKLWGQLPVHCIENTMKSTYGTNNAFRLSKNVGKEVLCPPPPSSNRIGSRIQPDMCTMLLVDGICRRTPRKKHRSSTIRTNGGETVPFPYGTSTQRRAEFDKDYITATIVIPAAGVFYSTRQPFWGDIPDESNKEAQEQWECLEAYPISWLRLIRSPSEGQGSVAQNGFLKTIRNVHRLDINTIGYLGEKDGDILHMSVMKMRSSQGVPVVKAIQMHDDQEEAPVVPLIFINIILLSLIHI